VISRKDSSDRLSSRIRRGPRCASNSASSRCSISRARLGLLAPLGDPDQPGPGVGGIGHPLDVAGLLELVDEEARGLLGHLRGLRQVGEPAAVLVDPCGDPALGDRCLEAVLGQVGPDACFGVPVDDEHEERGGQLHGLLP
jgi:hypothetical protein